MTSHHPSSDRPRHARLTLSGTRPRLDAAIDQFLRDAAHAGVDSSAMFGLRLALEEALSNALHHGNGGDPAKEIGFEYTISPHEIAIDIEDEGEGFDPAAVPDPTQEENLQIPAGRGLILMRAYMTSVEHPGRGNHVRMRWQRT
jgi:serine/threonine-protein kinase RsbW